MTPADYLGYAHSNFLVYQTPDKFLVENSIIQGGVIQMPLLKFGNDNDENDVTGNTTALADRQVNPKFNTDVASYPSNVAINQLINTDFSLALNSPAKGKGSNLTSVSQLLNP
jgi:hypothetical protein